MTDPAALSVELAARVERYNSTGDVQELDRAVGLCRASGRDPVILSNLASLLLARFQARHVRSDLEEARSVLAVLAGAGQITAHEAAMLARIAMLAYELDGDPVEVENAIRTAEFGLANAPPRDSALAELYDSLGVALSVRFDLAGRVADLDRAVDVFRAGAEGDTGEFRLVHLTNLARQCQRRINLAGAPPPDSALVGYAVAAADEVAASLPVEDPVRGEMLWAAGALLRYRYEEFGNPTDIQGSVRRLRRSVSLPAATPGEATSRLMSLSAALHREFQETGNGELLAEAIAGSRRVLAATRADHQDRPGQLNNLAALMRERTLYFNDLDALREAIELLREAIDLATDPAERVIYLGTLGVALQDVFARTWDPATADEAVARAREAIRLTGVNQDDRWLVLGNALTQKYQARGDPGDLAEALRVLTDLFDHMPTGRPARSHCLGALGRAWRLEFERTDDLQALDRAIEALGRVMRADPVPDPERAEYRQSYADLMLMQYERVRSSGPLRSAADAFAATARDPAVRPLARVRAASQWSAAAARLNDWPRALKAAELAMSLLPQVASRRLARTDRQHSIAQLAGLAADAAACALQADDPGLAVRWLEQGRGVLLGQTLDTRGDVAELGRRHPDAAARLAELDDALAELDIAATGSDRRHAVARQREELLGDIRVLPDFAEFLLPPTLSRVHEWAGPGPVVLVNVSRFRCDALVLTDHALVPIPLPHLTFDDAARNADRFTGALDMSTEPGREHEAGMVIAEVLEWLDDKVTDPVLTRLAHGGRVWWSPGGPLAALPLHAAGRPWNCVMDRAISSYTPTVRALGQARRAAAQMIRSPGMLTVSVPEPAGAPPLPFADKETARIGELWSATALTGANATADRVLDALGRHDYAHFACHGVHEPADPLASRLLLHDRPLTVAEVSREHLPDARLAVLSACHTARGAPHLADEALHLGGAFQLAGYPSVLATLWQVNDMIAAQMAIALHTALTETGHPPAPDRAAPVLHDVLQRFREYPPSIWASWVHSGA